MPGLRMIRVPDSDTRTGPAAPDFRNLGTLLRAMVLAEGANLVFQLAMTGHPLAALSSLLARAPLFETALLGSLLVMFLVAPRMATLAFRQHAAVGALVAAGVTAGLYLAFSRAWPDLFDGSPWLAGVFAAGLAAAVYFYFHWRGLALSPALAEARLMALQARIRPHFLFNSLNTVLGLLRQDPKRAESVLENLADLFRALLAETRNLVSLERELELARAYGDVETLRLGDRLRLFWHTQGAPLTAQVPQLLLQPLLENAVIHGIEPNQAGGDVHISALRKGDQLLIVVRNPLPSDNPGPQASTRGNGMALNNIRERLNLHFDAEARLTHYTAGGEFIVQIEIPIHT